MAASCSSIFRVSEGARELVIRIQILLQSGQKGQTLLPDDWNIFLSREILYFMQYKECLINYSYDVKGL